MGAVQLLAVTVAAVVFGCSSRPGELTVLELLSVSPAPNSSRVVASSSVTATFNQPMDEGGHWGEWFLLSGGSAPVEGAVTVEGAVVTFKPSRPLENETEYTVRLVRGSRGRTGVTLKDDYEYKFTTVPIGRFAVVLDNRGGWCQSGLWSYALDEISHRLVRRGNVRAPCGGTAYPDRTRGMALHPSGRLAFVTFDRYTSDDGKVFRWSPYLATYRLNPEDGSFRSAGELRVGSSGATVTVNPAFDYLYVAGNSWSGGEAQPALFSYRLELESGALTLVTGSPFTQDGLTSGLLFHPNGRFGYGSAAGGVAAFAVDPGTGALSGVMGSPYGSAGMSPLVLDPTGRFLFAAGSGGLQLFAVDAATGALSAKGSPLSTPAPLSELRVTADGGKAIALTGTALVAWTVDTATGALSQLAGSPRTLPGTARSVAVDPEGRWVLVWFESSSLLVPLLIGAGGIIAAPSASYDAGANVLGVDVEPSGKQAIVRTTSEVALWNIDANTAALERVSGLSLPGGGAEVGPTALWFVRGKRPVQCVSTYAYVLNRSSSSIAAFALGEGTGALSDRGAPLSLGGDASSLEVDWLGRRLFVIDPSGGRLAIVGVDSATGELSVLGGSPAAPSTGLQMASLDPSGSFVYLLRSAPPEGEGRVAVYSVDLESGALAGLGSTNGGSVAPARIAVDPSGERVYVMDGSGCQIGVLGIYRFGSTHQFAELGTPIAVSPCAGTGKSLAFDLEGRVIVVDEEYGMLVLTGPEPTGVAARASLPTRVEAMAVDPWGAFAWAATSAAGSARVQPFAVDGAGRLTLLDSVGAGTALQSLAVDPTGSFLYAVDSGSAKIHGFTIVRSTGALVPISGSPFASGGGSPTDMVVVNGCR